MEQADIDRVRPALRQRPKPPLRLLWRGRPLHLQPGGRRRMGPWSRRRLRLQAGWQLLWDERLRRNLAAIFQFVACRRERHRDAPVMISEAGVAVERCGPYGAPVTTKCAAYLRLPC
jgi:hypothetical protein